ncbi:hypothetical protein CV014_26685 [Nostoc sp. CMAA1605]|nr:hypothetical protein [Nostoc sp. CMAA1605]
MQQQPTQNTHFETDLALGFGDLRFIEVRQLVAFKRQKVSQRGLGGFPHERLTIFAALATQERHPFAIALRSKGQKVNFGLFTFTFLLPTSCLLQI